MPDAMRTVRILEILPHGPDLCSMVLPAPWEESACPGQFVFAWLPGIGEKPLSISDQRDGTFELTVRAVGPFTKAFRSLSVGDRLGIRGPFGHPFTGPEAPGRRRMLVAGGIGLAPIRFLLRTLHRAGLEAEVLIGARDASGLCFVQDFLDHGAAFATEDGSLGKKGLVTALLADALGSASGPTLVQACGPEAMLLRVRDMAQSHLAACELSFERYMKCGIGICGQCCADGTGLRLCVEGPVLGVQAMAGLTDLGLRHRDASGRRAP